MIFLAVKPPPEVGGFTAIIGVRNVSTKYGNGSTSPEKRRA